MLQSIPALAFDSCPCVTDKKLYYAVPTGKAGIDYRWNNVLFYASVSDGYKAGGITGFYITDVGALKPYMPEFVNAYEGGFKSTFVIALVAVRPARGSAPESAEELDSAPRSWTRRSESALATFAPR